MLLQKEINSRKSRKKSFLLLVDVILLKLQVHMS